METEIRVIATSDSTKCSWGAHETKPVVTNNNFFRSLLAMFEEKSFKHSKKE